jgi:hypothetical protein
MGDTERDGRVERLDSAFGNACMRMGVLGSREDLGRASFRVRCLACCDGVCGWFVAFFLFESRFVAFLHGLSWAAIFRQHCIIFTSTLGAFSSSFSMLVPEHS